MSARRLSLLDASTPKRLSAFIDKVMEPQPLQTPDQRIEAALEEIADAFREKWPGIAMRICNDADEREGSRAFIMVLPGLSFMKPGETEYMRNGKVVRRVGGGEFYCPPSKGRSP